jgi:hypothetical protein
VTNSVSVGAPLSTKSFSDANVIYSFTATATGATDVATLTIASGAVAQTTGTPTLADAGVDFEGAAIGTAAKVYAIQVEQTVDGAMAVDGDLTESNEMTKAGDKALWLWTDGTTGSGSALGGEIVILDLNATGVACKVTVIGKTA